MVLRITFFVAFALIAIDSEAQLRKKKQADRTDPTTQQPTSLNPSSAPQKQYTPKSSRQASKGPTYGLEQAYYERVEAVAKERRNKARGFFSQTTVKFKHR